MGSLSKTFSTGINHGRPLILLSFSVPENQLAVGSINEDGSTFNITYGDETFEISSLGVITFKEEPDYEVEYQYIIHIKSSKGKRYKVRVYVTDVLSLFSLNTGTNLDLETEM